MGIETKVYDGKIEDVINRMNSETFKIKIAYKEAVGHEGDYQLKVYYTEKGLPSAEPQMLSREDFEELEKKSHELNLHGHYHFICNFENLGNALKKTTRRPSAIRKITGRALSGFN